MFVHFLSSFLKGAAHLPHIVYQVAYAVPKSRDNGCTTIHLDRDIGGWNRPRKDCGILSVKICIDLMLLQYPRGAATYQAKRIQYVKRDRAPLFL